MPKEIQIPHTTEQRAQAGERGEAYRLVWLVGTPYFHRPCFYSLLPERPAPSEGRQITRPAWLHPTLFTVRRKGAEGEHSAGASARPS